MATPKEKLAALRASVTSAREELRLIEERKKERDEVRAELEAIEAETSKLRAQAQAMAKRVESEEESMRVSEKQRGRWHDPAKDEPPDSAGMSQTAAALRKRNAALTALMSKVSDPSVSKAEEAALHKGQQQQQSIERELQACVREVAVQEKRVANAQRQAALVQATKAAPVGSEDSQDAMVQAYVQRLESVAQTTREAKEREQAKVWERAARPREG